MMRYLTAFAVLLLSAGLLLPTSPVRHAAPVMVAQTPTPSLEVSGGDPKVVKVKRVIEVFDDRTVYTTFPVVVKAPTGFGYQWEIPAGLTATRKGSQLDVTGGNGTFTVSVTWYVVDFKAQTVTEQFAQRVLDLGDIKPPEPVPPKPPEPDPKPKPDGTSPFSEAGFRVMISFEPNVLMPPGDPRRGILMGQPVQNYLNAKCVLGPANEKDASGQQMRDWRIWPSNTDAKYARPVLRDAWAKRGDPVKDWILVGDGRTGYNGPLPKTEAEVLALLKKYGGE